MRFQLCLTALFIVVAPYLALAQPLDNFPRAPANYIDDSIVTLVYDPMGEFWLAHPLDDGGLESDAAKLTTMQVKSTEDFFMEFDWCPNLIDGCSPRNALNLDPAGFASLPPIRVTPGFSFEQLSRQLSGGGSLLGGGPLEIVDLHVVPEPNASSFACWAGLMSVGLLRKRPTKRCRVPSGRIRNTPISNTPVSNI